MADPSLAPAQMSKMDSSNEFSSTLQVTKKEKNRGGRPPKHPINILDVKKNFHNYVEEVDPNTVEDHLVKPASDVPFDMASGMEEHFKNIMASPIVKKKI